MNFTDYQCKHCGQKKSIAISRVTQASFLRCDACFAISSLSLGERLLLIEAASRERPSTRTAHRTQYAATA